jgi:hypothetical protein
VHGQVAARVGTMCVLRWPSTVSARVGITLSGHRLAFDDLPVSHLMTEFR